jgi:hypothetical protein
MARVREAFPLQCPACGGDIQLIAFITEPGPIRKILTHLGEPLEPPPLSPARGPPTEWGELVQRYDDRDGFQPSPDEMPAIDIHLAVSGHRQPTDARMRKMSAPGATNRRFRSVPGPGNPRDDRPGKHQSATSPGAHATHRAENGCGSTIDRTILLATTR